MHARWSRRPSLPLGALAALAAPALLAGTTLAAAPHADGASAPSPERDEARRVPTRPTPILGVGPMIDVPALPAGAPTVNLWSTCPRIPFEAGVTRLARTLGSVALASEDLDGDGRDELLVLGAVAPSELLVVNVRDGRLSVRQTIAFDDPILGLMAAATGDFTGDGMPDVALGDQGSRVVLLRNDGTGTLEFVTTLVPDEPSIVSPSDLEMLTTGLVPGATASIVQPRPVAPALEWQIDADGNVVTTQSPIEGYATSAVLDVDEDGLEDLIFGGYSSGSTLEASWVRRLPDGTWTEPTGLGPASTGAHPDIDVVDVTGDGLDDVVLVRWDSNGSPDDPQFLTAVNDPAGDFAAVIPSGSLRTQGLFTWGAVADWNGDGHMDVLTTAGPLPDDGSDVNVQIGDGTGAFTEQYTMSDTRGGGPTVVIDADGDGDGDLITSEPYFSVTGTDDTLTVRLNRGNLPGGTIDVQQTGLLAVTDVDGAPGGRSELLTVDGGDLVVSALDAFDQPIELGRVTLDPDRTRATDIVTAGVAGVGDGVRCAIALRRPIGPTDRRVVVVRFDGLTPVVEGDADGFDGDQRVTFFGRGGSPTGGLAVVESPNVATFACTDAGLDPITTFTVAVASVSDERLGLTAGDLDGDGHDDLVVGVVANGSEDEPAVVIHGDGTGFFSDPRSLTDADGGFAGSTPFIADFDGDGAIELVRAGDSDAPARIVRQAPDRRYVIEDLPVVLSTAGLDEAAYQATLADIDGDGALDIVASSRIRPSVRIISSVPGAGVIERRLIHRATRSDGTFEGPHGAGDLNGDGTIDIAFVDDQGRVAVLRGGGCGVQCPTDLDLDGETGFTDLLTVLGTFGATSTDLLPEIGDLDENGVVDFIDLLTVLGSWGVCPE